MRRAAVAGVVVLAASGAAVAVRAAAGAPVSGAGPVVTAPARVDAPAQRAALERALRLVSVRDRLGQRLVLGSPRRGVRAQFDAARHTITVFLDPLDAPHRVAHDIAHELGHAWDAARMDAAARADYLRRRGVPHASWWPVDGSADYASGAGDFAEVFAACHAASPDFRSRLAPRPTDPCAVLPAPARRAA